MVVSPPLRVMNARGEGTCCSARSCQAAFRAPKAGVATQDT